VNHSIPSLRHCFSVLAAATLFGGIWQAPAFATGQTQLQCINYSETGSTLHNQGSLSYETADNTGVRTQVTGFSNPIASTITRSGVLDITSQGIRDGNGNLVFGLGMVADALNGELVQLGFTSEEATQSSLAAVQVFAALPASATSQEATVKVKKALSDTVPEKAVVITESAALDRNLPLILTGLAQPSLASLGLTATEASQASQAAMGVVAGTSGNTPLHQIARQATEAAIAAVPTQAELLSQDRQGLDKELENLRSGAQSSLQAGSSLYYQFLLGNSGTAAVTFQLPEASTIQQSGFTGPGTVTAVSYEVLTTNSDNSASANPTNPSQLTIQPGGQIKLTVAVTLNSLPETATAMSVGFGSGCDGSAAQGTVALLPPLDNPLIDPFGRVTGCAGEILPDYRGFTVGLYDPAPNDATGEVADIVPLTKTERPDRSDIPEDIEPNTQNSNPFYLTNSDKGSYSFLLDEQQGQLQPGRTYILLVNPPPGSDYAQRRIRIAIGDRQGKMVNYTATSLDGRPVNTTDNRTVVSGAIAIEDAERVGLVLAILNLKTSVCEAQEIQITKTGDRAAAEPGDTVIYRLAIRNLARTDVDNILVTDTLPFGFQLQPDSVRGEILGQPVTVNTLSDNRTITFAAETSIPSGQVLNIAYAAQLTPDALRGSGENLAIVNAQRADNRLAVKDGPAVHRLRIRPGIIADCGTLIGRVFVDKNFDGEQQPGEPGVPNAVIFMEDGNRVTTDANGLFSVANVLPGNHTGTLDLSSIPGYTIAPNLYFSERNSRSRLVRLEPGGMARMNFAVTPTVREDENQ
jgi:uncharacterized repeat protein (TIGR01451 family)